MNTNIDHAKKLARLARLARLMDSKWRLPFTNIRFGLDPLFGLIPGAGDVINLGVSTYALVEAKKLGAPNAIIIKMLGNMAIDFGLGTVPVLGDVFDMFFKSNTKNLKLLTDFLEKKIKP